MLSHAPRPRALRHPCGSRPAWSPPSPAPRPSDRSRAGLQRMDHGRNRRGIRAEADPERDAVDLDLDDAAVLGPLGRLPKASALPRRALRRRARWGNDSGHERLRLGSHRDRNRLSHLPAPRKQLLRRQSVPPRDLRYHGSRGQRLLNKPRLVVGRELPPSAALRDDLDPTNRVLGSSNWSHLDTSRSPIRDRSFLARRLQWMVEPKQR